MSIHHLIKDAQEKNKILISEIEEPILESYKIKLEESNKLFETVLMHVLCYPYENKNEVLCDFEYLKALNLEIFQKLLNRDIETEEAKLLSNALFVKFFNKLRTPGEAQINISNYRNTPYFIINH